MHLLKTENCLTNISSNELKKNIEKINFVKVNDHEMNNRKAAAENNDLLRQLEVVDNNLSVLHKARHQLNQELDQGWQKLLKLV